ncbi:MAG: hypothetical protein L0Y71_01995 [Gemmataceae bacterium]|nr:hypothetical protein [Gemmataceae bacterium]
MTRIILDDQLKKRLRNLAEPLELCDRGGRVVARLFPENDADDLDREPKISRAEIRRRMASKEKTYTTKEVIAHLEKL